MRVVRVLRVSTELADEAAEGVLRGRGVEVAAAFGVYVAKGEKRMYKFCV